MNNALSVRSIVKLEKCPYASLVGKNAEIKAIYKNFLFVWMKNALPLKENNGYLVVTTRDVILAGHEFTKNVQTADTKAF